MRSPAFTIKALAGAPPVLILFGLVDVAGAAWTFMALRGQAPVTGAAA